MRKIIIYIDKRTKILNGSIITLLLHNILLGGVMIYYFYFGQLASLSEIQITTLIAYRLLNCKILFVLEDGFNTNRYRCE